jgi:predicted Rossmann fold nucleotide-binding protein DprA/Smf involved in DNA uptake
VTTLTAEDLATIERINEGRARSGYIVSVDSMLFRRMTDSLRDVRAELASFQAEETARKNRMPMAQKILEMLAIGPLSLRQLAAGIGTTRASVSTQLCGLFRGRLVRRTARGVYALPARKS